MSPQPHSAGLLRRLRHQDAGIGVITVVLVMAVVTALTVTATALTVNNLDNSRRDRQALSALSTSEAGVSQAIQHLRGGNLGALTCVEPAPGAAPGATCTDPALAPALSWISATSPKEVLIDGATGSCATSGNCFKVWIGTVQRYNPSCAGRSATPPVACFGVYRVHSTGLAGGGPGARKLAVDVKVTPYPFPIGVFAEEFSGNGNVGIHRQSVFTNGCIKNRQDDSRSGSGFQFDWDAANGRPVLDLIYDQPSAAHATGAISTSNNSCGAGSGGYPIHQRSRTNTAQQVCNTTFPFDQDSGGGPLTAGDGCYGKYTRVNGSGTVYPTTSKFTSSDLATYGYRPRGLSDAQYDALRSQAKSQGTYNIATGSINSALTSLAAAGISSPVLFWDNGDVALSSSDFPNSFRRTLNTSTSCSSNSVTIVVTGPGNDLKLSGGNTSPYLVAAIFVPDGELGTSGGSNIIGTAFAKEIDLGGNLDFYMDECFANNPPGAVLDAQVTNWREDDSKDIN